MSTVEMQELWKEVHAAQTQRDREAAGEGTLNKRPPTTTTTSPTATVSQSHSPLHLPNGVAEKLVLSGGQLLTLSARGSTVEIRI